MSEPTKSQYDILISIQEDGPAEKNNDDEDIGKYWELVRAGYLNNFVSIGVMWDWKFMLTDKATEYLKV